MTGLQCLPAKVCYSSRLTGASHAAKWEGRLGGERGARESGGCRQRERGLVAGARKEKALLNEKRYVLLASNKFVLLNQNKFVWSECSGLLLLHENKFVLSVHKQRFC